MMTSSQGTDISTQTNQSRLTISQPQAASRPHSIAELVEMAKDSLGEGDFPFKTWLRIAENARRDAKSYQEQGDFESAFVEYAKAAMIVLEKIPTHPQYRVLLSTTQRHNMGLHGQEILDGLAEIKVPIMNRYEQWRANPSESSVQVQSQQSRAAPASDLSPQVSVFRRSVYSNETNTLSPFSTRSSPWMCTSIRSRGHRLPPYGQSPHEGDRVQHEHEHVLDMPEVMEEQGTLSSLGLIGVLSLESSESSTLTVLAESPAPPFIPSPYIPSPSPASPTHSHSSSSSLDTLSTPPPSQKRRDSGFSLPPPQMAKPPRGAYHRVVRYGFWNRRGDYLTMDKYVVYAQRGRMNPPDLENYPAPTEGYMDHHGNFIKYDPTLNELPESLPRQGQPPVLPYDKFITYVYL